ncbi:MAG: hypothetical protein JXR61_12670 [Prolixibacteraceae bacterium]|nr:hypothetical protein [Prolixibacteraceae bacterium]
MLDPLGKKKVQSLQNQPTPGLAVVQSGSEIVTGLILPLAGWHNWMKSLDLYNKSRMTGNYHSLSRLQLDTFL